MTDAGGGFRRGLRSALALALAASGGACVFDRARPVLPTSYDFGPPVALTRANPMIPATVRVTPVTTPAWLDDSGIAYRLLYDAPAQPRVYAMSRWAAAPAALLTERLHARMAAVAAAVVGARFNVRADYVLRVELEDFSQHFTSPTDSRVTFQARATLLGSDGRELVAQQVFSSERSSAPDASGAVAGLTAAAEAFSEDVVKWTAHHIRSRRPGSEASR